MKPKTKAIVLPTAEEVPALTDRLVVVNEEIAVLTDERKLIQARLEAYALTQQTEPLKDGNREGRRVPLAGHRYRLPVVFTSDLLIGSFKDGSPKHNELRRILSGEIVPTAADMRAADEKLALFFDPPATWEGRYDDGMKFRAAAAEHLSEEIAPKFIAACTATDKHGIKKSKTVFDFVHAERLDGKEGE